MHLLHTQVVATSASSDAPIDLQQTPSDIIILSHADSELATFSSAAMLLRNAGEFCDLRLANIGCLGHPYSIDTYIENTLKKSRLILMRVLGGVSYWRYGFEQMQSILHNRGITLVLLPGDDKEDSELLNLSSVSASDWHALWEYCKEGGVDNACNLLRYCYHLLCDIQNLPLPPKKLLKAGIYWPALNAPSLSEIKNSWQEDAGVAAIIFYRSLLQGAALDPINKTIAALLERNINPLPIFVTSLRDAVSAATLSQIFHEVSPSLILNATGFSLAPAMKDMGDNQNNDPLTLPDCPVLQIVLSTASIDSWHENTQGLSTPDLVMNVATPEMDGRILSRAISFKEQTHYDDNTQCHITTYVGVDDRIAFVSELVKNWISLARAPPSERRVAFIVANYPNKDGRLCNGVGLDTPASLIIILQALKDCGYDFTNIPADSASLMELLLAGTTNAPEKKRYKETSYILSLSDYLEHFQKLPLSVISDIKQAWGEAIDDPFFIKEKNAFVLPVHRFGNSVIGIQPARGYNIDPKATYHCPDLIPPHGYLATYFWIRHVFDTHAIVHTGKHGNLEWLPGKALALSQKCYPEICLGPLPHFYPFIVNDPGEGTQAKRRTQAVIIDHMTPPLTRAETYGKLQTLENLVDEYYVALHFDKRRADYLKEEILLIANTSGLLHDVKAGADIGKDDTQKLEGIDNYLCELKEAQIRHGLHIFGRPLQLQDEIDTLLAIARPSRGSASADMSLLQALSHDLGMTPFDPLNCTMSAVWNGLKHPDLLAVSTDLWRTCGDTVERLEKFAQSLIAKDKSVHPSWTKVLTVMNWLDTKLRPLIQSCGAHELKGLIDGLSGRFVSPGASGAPTRGRPDVFPMGRNFFSVDTRAIPTQAAWALGWKSATLLLEKHLHIHGDWPQAVALTVWGTANMRTGGDDIAQGMALIGVRPCWDNTSNRITGFEILPQSVLNRPRIDVTLRISGFFRDAFPAQIELFASATRAVMELDESDNNNFLACHFRTEKNTWINTGNTDSDAADLAGNRIFGSKPGAYGAGLQAMIDEKLWTTPADLANAYMTWGSYAYGGKKKGDFERQAFEQCLSRVDAIVQNQDNREHDLLDSDDYYQFEGGMTAAVRNIRGDSAKVTTYHNDHSRPSSPQIRTLEDEIGRVINSRVVNPKWIDGVKAHGYKGAFEIAATVDYMFAFSATTGAVKNHHFDLAYDAFLGDDDTRNFIKNVNAPALKEIAEKFMEAIDRNLWQPGRNDVFLKLKDIVHNPPPISPL